MSHLPHIYFTLISHLFHISVSDLFHIYFTIDYSQSCMYALYKYTHYVTYLCFYTHAGFVSRSRTDTRRLAPTLGRVRTGVYTEFVGFAVDVVLPGGATSGL